MGERMRCKLVECSVCGNLSPARTDLNDCVFCSLTPIRPTAFRCSHPGCNNRYDTNTKMHLELDGNSIIDPSSGLPIEVVDEDVLKAVSMLYKATFYLIGPMCAEHMNEHVSPMIGQHSHTLIIRFANLRLQTSFSEDWA